MASTSAAARPEVNSYGEFGILGNDLWLEILRKTHPHDRVALFSTCKAFSYLFDEVEKDAKLPANRTDARKQALLDAEPVYTTEWYLWQYEGVRSEERRLKKMAQDPYEQQREQRKRKWMTKDKDVTYEPMQSYHLAYLAAFQGHVEALTYFRDEGVPLPLWSWECAHRAAGNGNLDALKLMASYGFRVDSGSCFWAARGGHVHVLQWLVDQGLRLDLSRCDYSGSSRMGMIEVLRLLNMSGCPWYNVSICSEAAKGGHLDAIKWLRAQDPPGRWDCDTSALCAGGGHLDALKWLRSQDKPCPWNESACQLAAGGGHLDVLKWLRCEGCDWDFLTAYHAARGGHLDVLKWALENGCMWQKETCRGVASLKGHHHVAAWIAKQADDILPPSPPSTVDHNEGGGSRDRAEILAEVSRAMELRRRARARERWQNEPNMITGLRGQTIRQLARMERERAERERAEGEPQGDT